MVFSTTTPRRPPVTVMFSSFALVEYTWKNSPMGWSCVVMSRITQSAHRLIRKPPAPSPVAVIPRTTSLLWAAATMP